MLHRSHLLDHELLLQITSPDRPDKDFFYGFSTLRELQFTETSFLVMEPWRLSGKLYESFKEEGRNLGERQHQIQGKCARTYGENTFLKYLMKYVQNDKQAMKSRINWDMEDSPLVRFKIRPIGNFKNKNIYDHQDILMAPDKSIR